MTESTTDAAATPRDPNAITREYPAGALTVEWRQGRCQHSGNCVKALPRVFNPRKQPWIETSAADEAAIEAAVGKCPSGALQIRKA